MATPLASSTNPTPPSVAAAGPKAIAALEAAVAAWNIADGPDEAHGFRWTVYLILRALLTLALGAWSSPAGKVATEALEGALVRLEGPEGVRPPPRAALVVAIEAFQDAYWRGLGESDLELMYAREILAQLRQLDAMVARRPKLAGDVQGPRDRSRELIARTFPCQAETQGGGR